MVYSGFGALLRSFHVTAAQTSVIRLHLVCCPYPPVQAPSNLCPLHHPPCCLHTDWRTQLLNLVNNARRNQGLRTLCLNTKLNNAAQAHSQDMVSNNFFDHTGSDGSKAWDRMLRAGYRYSWAGENIAMGQTSVQQVFNSWWNSQGHRNNILNPNYQHMGAANVNNRWTQVFGSSSSEGCN